MSHHSHADKHDQEIYKYGPVGEPSEPGQCADLAHCVAHNGPDKTADAVAEVEPGNLRDGLSVMGEAVRYRYFIATLRSFTRAPSPPEKEKSPRDWNVRTHC